MHPRFISTADGPNSEHWGWAGGKAGCQGRGAGPVRAGEMPWLHRMGARGGQVAAKVGQVSEQWGKLL